MGQNKHEHNSNFIAKLIMFIFLAILISIAGIMIYVGIVLSAVPTSEVINEDDAPLAPGEVWTVDDQFSIWIDSVEEIPAETAQTLYPELASGIGQPLSKITDTEGKHYFDVTFSFENINFEGCYYKDELEYDYLEVHTISDALDENIKTVWPAPFELYDKRSYYTALENGIELPVTPGITSTDNHMIVEIGTATGDEIQPAYFRVGFVVSVETLSSEASIQYKQQYIIPVP